MYCPRSSSSINWYHVNIYSNVDLMWNACRVPYNKIVHIPNWHSMARAFFNPSLAVVFFFRGFCLAFIHFEATTRMYWSLETFYFKPNKVHEEAKTGLSFLPELWIRRETCNLKKIKKNKKNKKRDRTAYSKIVICWKRLINLIVKLKA